MRRYCQFWNGKFCVGVTHQEAPKIVQTTRHPGVLKCPILVQMQAFMQAIGLPYSYLRVLITHQNGGVDITGVFAFDEPEHAMLALFS